MSLTDQCDNGLCKGRCAMQHGTTLEPLMVPACALRMLREVSGDA